VSSGDISVASDAAWSDVQTIIPNDREQETQADSDVPSLSRDDVLVGDSFIPQAAESQSEETSQENIDEQDETSQTTTGTWEIINERETPSLEREVENDDSLQDAGDERADATVSSDLCENPLAWPISSGWDNDPVEVKKLEAFLIANAYLSWSDGIYGNADFEAVKKLQLDYKAQMLDPWGIDTPTWYVWSTTVATINSIWCKN